MSVKNDMFVIYNSDGSIKISDIPCFIQQNNHNVNRIFVAIVGRSVSDYSLAATFTLSNDDTEIITASSTGDITIDGSTYTGRYFYLTSAVTYVAGNLLMSIRAVDTNQATLFTYNVKLFVNKTTDLENNINITLSQYKNLVDTIQTYELKYVINNRRNYANSLAIASDILNLAEGQVVSYLDESGTYTIYGKIVSGQFVALDQPIHINATETITGSKTFSNNVKFANFKGIEYDISQIYFANNDIRIYPAGNVVTKTILPNGSESYSVGSNSYWFLNGYIKNIYTDVLNATTKVSTVKLENIGSSDLLLKSNNAYLKIESDGVETDNDILPKTNDNIYLGATTKNYGIVYTKKLAYGPITTKQVDRLVETTDIVNNTNSQDTSKPLSANMGKELQDQINNLKAIGRYLSGWNCATGLPTSNPTTLPYTYKAGDYFIVTNVASGGTNYQPYGSQYTGQASTTPVGTIVKVNDYFRFDGTNWQLEINTQRTVSWGQIGGTLSNQTDLKNALDEKATTTQLSAKADDSAVVHKAGNETIAGDKTFTGDIFADEIWFNDTSSSDPAYLRLYEDGDAVEISSLFTYFGEFENGLKCNDAALISTIKVDSDSSFSVLAGNTEIFEVSSTQIKVPPTITDGTYTCTIQNIKNVIDNAERTENKTSIVNAESTNAQYPNAQAVYNYGQSIADIPFKNVLGTVLGRLKFVQCTQAEYDAITTPDSTTLYIIVG